MQPMSRVHSKYLAFPVLKCFANTINLAVRKGLEDNVISRLLGKVKALVSVFKQSYLKTEELHNNEKMQDIKVTL